MKLQNALKGLICEIASVDSVVNAIKNKQYENNYTKRIKNVT